MTKEEALDVTEMVLTNWRVRDWTKEEMNSFATGIQHLDAEIAVSTVARAAAELKFAPKIAEFLEIYRAERKRLRPQVSPPDTAGRPLDLWVKRWICARFLYSRWDKERDLRRFPEQLDFGDPTQELMPEGAWQKEAESLEEGELLRTFRLVNTS